MAETNGSPVTRAELGAHIKGIDASFKTVTDDITEIKGLIEGIYQTFRLERRERSARWQTWGPPITAAFIAGAIALPAYIIH